MRKITVKGDIIIWMVILVLSVISLMGVYSSSSSLVWKMKGGFTEYYLIRHGIFILIGLFIIYRVHLIPYRYFSRIFLILLYISIPLLILTLVSGKDLNQARRVLALPFGLSFQTSDLAKLALIVYLAREIALKHGQYGSFKVAFIRLMLPVLLVAALIFPADFSTAAIVFTTALVLMFVGKVPWKYIFSTVGIALAGAGIMFALAYYNPDFLGRKNTWKKRIEQYLSSDDVVAGKDGTVNKKDKEDKRDEKFQSVHAKIAIASGGLVGKGPGNSSERNFLPLPYSDFIFSLLIEEYGMVTGIIILLMYFYLFYRALIIIRKMESHFGMLLAFGIVFSIVFQALIHMGINVGLLPVTGIPLPLISMGGTSLIFTSIGLGVLLSVSRELKEQQAKTE